MRDVIKGPRCDRYRALCVLDQAGGKGKTQYFLAVGPCVYFRAQVNWNSWNEQRRKKPQPEFLLLDDVDIFGEASNINSDNRRKAIMNGTKSFSLCTRGGAFSVTVHHGLPVVVLTNDMLTWLGFR